MCSILLFFADAFVAKAFTTTRGGTGLAAMTASNLADLRLGMGGNGGVVVCSSFICIHGG